MTGLESLGPQPNASANFATGAFVLHYRRNRRACQTFLNLAKVPSTPLWTNLRTVGARQTCASNGTTPFWISDPSSNFKIAAALPLRMR